MGEEAGDEGDEGLSSEDGPENGGDKGRQVVSVTRVLRERF